MNLLTGYFPIFKKNLMKKSQNFFIIFFAKIFRYDKKYPASQHPDVSRFNYSQYGSFTDSSITRRVVYPGHPNGSVWMSGPSLSLHHPIPHLLIPEVFLPSAGPVPGFGRVFLSEYPAFSEFIPP